MQPELIERLFAPSAESVNTVTNVSHPVRTVACLVASDSLAVIIAMLAASVLRDLILVPHSPLVSPQIFAALLLTLSSLTVTGLYPGVALNPVEELRLSTVAVTLAFFGMWSATLFLRDLTQSRFVCLIGYMLAVCFVPLLRTAVRRMFAARAWWGSPVAILGYGETGKAVYASLNKNKGIGLKIVAVLDDNPDQLNTLDDHILRGAVSRCSELISGGQKIPYGIVCMPGLSREELLSLVDCYSHWFGHLIVIPNLMGMTSLGVTAREVGGVVGLEMRKQLLRPVSRLTKRLLDLFFTLLLAPFISLAVGVCAILIKLEDSGPAFYASERIGLDGKKFNAWKLRSMVTSGDAILAKYLESNAEEAATWRETQKLKDDPRITRVGRFIRRTSIDELPQFWNVFQGEMSVVGPRPILARQIPLYGSGFVNYKRMRPGLTGLWQISGRNNLSFAERSKLDQYVIQNWSVWLDLYILARTPIAVFTARGAS